MSFVDTLGNAFDRAVDGYTETYLEKKRAEAERDFRVDDPAAFQRTDTAQGGAAARAAQGGTPSPYMVWGIGAALLIVAVLLARQ